MLGAGIPSSFAFMRQYSVLIADFKKMCMQRADSQKSAKINVWQPNPHIRVPGEVRRGAGGSGGAYENKTTSRGIDINESELEISIH